MEQYTGTILLLFVSLLLQAQAVQGETTVIHKLQYYMQESYI